MKIDRTALAALGLLVWLGGISPGRAWAQAQVVHDPANYQANLASSASLVAQLEQQFKQVGYQIKQYEEMIRNGVPPANYNWGQIQATIEQLMRSVSALEQYKQNSGGLESYLRRFQDVSHYRKLPCFSGGLSCDPAQLAPLLQSRTTGSEARKRANDALQRNASQQMDSLRTDMLGLQRLQLQAQTAKGRMEALGYANQFSSQQLSQLLQIRSLLIAQQNALAAKMQADADREAQQQAGTEELMRAKFIPSPPRSWP